MSPRVPTAGMLHICLGWAYGNARRRDRDLRNPREQVIMVARKAGGGVTLRLNSKGINDGWITANASGQVDYSRVEGVDPDQRVKPFFAEESTISIREFVAGAMPKEVGIGINEPDLAKASKGGRAVTPSGMVLRWQAGQNQPAYNA